MKGMKMNSIKQSETSTLSLDSTYKGYISEFNLSYEKVFNSDEIAKETML